MQIRECHLKNHIIWCLGGARGVRDRFVGGACRFLPWPPWSASPHLTSPCLIFSSFLLILPAMINDQRYRELPRSRARTKYGLLPFCELVAALSTRLAKSGSSIASSARCRLPVRSARSAACFMYSSSPFNLEQRQGRGP